MFLNEFVLFEKLAKMTTRQWCFAAGALVVAVGLLVYLAKRPQKQGKTDVHALTYGALCMAMSFVLSYIKLWSMPLGGSVTLASMLPLLWYSNKFGVKNGLIAGAAYGLLQLIQKPEIYHWVQVLLDYPLAFMMLGLAGCVKNLQLGSILGVAGRWVCHILSGAIFFAEWVPEGWSNAWIYSAAYNGAYLLVDLIICLVLSFVLAKALDKIPTGRK
ncbi:MAG: energy-coupled thiamine transporter ThiT [Clostridia bacterium]|nr:energy-coupled thiamine transporter ThiT [Clostridia bacterium]